MYILHLLCKWVTICYVNVQAYFVLCLPRSQMISFIFVNVVDWTMSVNGFHHYCVTVRDGDTVKHYRIRQLDEGGFFIARRVTFRTLSELVDHYSTDADGLCVNLRKPCSQVSRTFRSSLLHCFCFFPFFLALFYDTCVWCWCVLILYDMFTWHGQTLCYSIICSHDDDMDRHCVIILYPQSCQPLLFGHSLLRPRALHYAATLTVISLRRPSEKQKLFIFDPMCSCGHQIRQQPVVCVPLVSEMLVVPQPIGVCVLTSWPIVAFGSVLALTCHYLARQLPFSIISNHYAEVRSRNRAPGWWVSPKKIKKKKKFQEEYDTEQFLCIVQSMQSPKHVKCSACFFSSWRNVRRRTMRELEVSHQKR